MVYGYARGSVKISDSDENSLESQIKALKLNGCEEIIKESFSSIKADRPKFQELINCLIDGDTLVVTKLDKFARSAFQGCMIIEELINRGIRVNILNMGIIDNTPSSGLIRTIFLAFAIFERDIIVERTQEGKAIAKEKGGFKEGRPRKYADTQINTALDLLKEHSYTEVVKLTKISKATLVRAMRKRKLGQ